MKFKGITVGTYITKRPKENVDKNICTNCEIFKSNKYQKANDEQKMEMCKECDKFYFSKNSKAILTIGRDQTTGKTIRKSFYAPTEEEALNNALEYKINMDRNGGPRLITKTNKTFIDLVKPLIEEQYKLKHIKEATYKRKMDTLKKLEEAPFANKPIAKVTRSDVVNYLSKISNYSKTTIKQNYELLCMGFGEAYHTKLINDNFMEGYKRVEKPKSEYKSHHRIALTIEEERRLIKYLNEVEYAKFKHKFLFLLLLSTGIRIGEALTLDYKKDIDFEKGILIIRRTQTRDMKGKSRIGETTKTSSGQRTIYLNDISKKALQDAVRHSTPNKFHLLFYNLTNKQYGLYEESTINAALKRAGLKLGIGLYEEINSKGEKVTRTDIHTHILRGTFATRCAEAKVAPVVLKDLLGHSDIAVTMKYYIDVDKDFINSENKNVVNYLLDKDLFGIDFSKEENELHVSE